MLGQYSALVGGKSSGVNESVKSAFGIGKETDRFGPLEETDAGTTRYIASKKNPSPEKAASGTTLLLIFRQKSKKRRCGDSCEISG